MLWYPKSELRDTKTGVWALQLPDVILRKYDTLNIIIA